VNLTPVLDIDSCSKHPISSGGFGDVYHGRFYGGKFQVAIKTVRHHINSSDEAQKPLKHAARELHTWSKCRHPNVLTLLGLVEFRNQIGMVSLWMENGSLLLYLEKNPDVDRCQMSVQICDGLSYLHQNKIIHGDLKGPNVLISSDGIPVLTDFGNAVLQERSLLFTQTTTKHSLSPRWAAPELLEGSKYSVPADVYALGMTLLETITGHVPYIEKSDLAVFTTVVVKKEHPTRPEKFIPSDSQHGDTLWLLLTRCWAYEPETRPSAADVGGIMQTITREGLMDASVEAGTGRADA